MALEEVHLPITSHETRSLRIPETAKEAPINIQICPIKEFLDSVANSNGYPLPI